MCIWYFQCTTFACLLWGRRGVTLPRPLKTLLAVISASCAGNRVIIFYFCCCWQFSIYSTIATLKHVETDHWHKHHVVFIELFSVTIASQKLWIHSYSLISLQLQLQYIFRSKTHCPTTKLCIYLILWQISASWFKTFAMFWMLYDFFWVIPRRLNFVCWRFGTLCSIFIGRWAWSMTRFQKC